MKVSGTITHTAQGGGDELRHFRDFLNAIRTPDQWEIDAEVTGRVEDFDITGTPLDLTDLPPSGIHAPANHTDDDARGDGNGTSKDDARGFTKDELRDAITHLVKGDSHTTDSPARLEDFTEEPEEPEPEESDRQNGPDYATPEIASTNLHALTGRKRVIAEILESNFPRMMTSKEVAHQALAEGRLPHDDREKAARDFSADMGGMVYDDGLAWRTRPGMSFYYQLSTLPLREIQNGSD